jgi:hypothetical protein
MNVVVALLIFLGVAAATRVVAIPLYESWVGDRDLRLKAGFLQVCALAVGFVSLTSLVPFPGGHLLSLVIWGLVAGHLNLPWPRASALFLILTVLSFLSRFVLVVFWPAPPARAAASYPAALPSPGPWA